MKHDRHASWTVWIGSAIVLAGLAAGCARGPKLEVTLPERRAVVLDQLVVHSDFDLPPHHRLLDDLRMLRGDLLAQLDLPASEEPVQVYLFDNDEQFSTFMRLNFPTFPLRRAFFVETDTRLAVYAHWGDRVAEDLRHEVAHGYLHSVVPTIPLWIDEGLAEYFEVPRGHHGLNNPHVELLLGQLLQVGWRPNLERLEALSTAAAMDQADYAESWAWAHLLMETTPERRSVLNEYLRELREKGSAESLSIRIRRLEPQPEQALVQHLYALRPPLAPAAASTVPPVLR